MLCRARGMMLTRQLESAKAVYIRVSTGHSGQGIAVAYG
ncbi:hypothetical protein M3J09_010165 [Ascochyta lentis]